MRPIIYLAATVILASCATPKYFGNGEYVSNGYSKPLHITDLFNEYDSKNLIDAGLKELQPCKDDRLKLNTVMVGRFDNQTSEAIDVEQFSREFIDSLSQNGYPLIDKASRPDLHQEYVYNDAGYVNPALGSTLKGKQDAVRVVFRGVISSKVQVTRDEKFVRYRLSIQAVDVESARVLCTATTELRKKYERTYVAF